jgi:anti-anti-sigma regulatory factor
LLKTALLSRIQALFCSIRADHFGPDGTQRGNFVIQQQSLEQLIPLAETQEVDTAAQLAGMVREALLKPGNLRVDLQGAGRIHTAVLQILIAAQRSCFSSDRTFVISGAAPEMKLLLQMAGLNMSNPA